MAMKQGASRKRLTSRLLTGCIALAGIFMMALVTACPTDDPAPRSPSFTAVTGITANVPAAMTVGDQLSLTGTAEPPNATNQDIVWSIDQNNTTAGATLTGSLLQTTSQGTITLIATITDGKAIDEDFTQSFTITVNVGSDFKAVTGITFTGNTVIDIYTSAPPYILTAIIEPNDASTQNVTWSISLDGTQTGNAATIGNVLMVSSKGSVTILATIRNGAATGDFVSAPIVITVTDSFEPVTDITFTAATAMNMGDNMLLTAAVTPDNATNSVITWDINWDPAKTTAAGAEIIGMHYDYLTAASAGKVTVIAIIENGKTKNQDFEKEFEITINDVFEAITGIINVPTTMAVGTPLALTGTIQPAEATVKEPIAWEIIDAETTAAGAEITNDTMLNAAGIGMITVVAKVAGGGANRTEWISDPIAITVNQFNVRFDAITNSTVSIAPHTISRSSGLSYTYSIPDAEWNLYDAIVWSIEGTTITGTSQHFVIEPNNPVYWAIGEHYLTVEALLQSDGKWYNTTITFTVAE